MLNGNLKGLARIGAILLVAILAIAFVACSGSGDAATPVDEAEHSDDEAAHDGDEATHDDDEATHDDDEAAHDDDEAAHDEGDDVNADMDDMDMGDDADANSYLEAAPKDALYLVEMTNFAFTPNVLEVNAGEVLEIAIQNVEAVLHDFTIDEIDADVHVSYLGGTGQHAHAEEGNADVHFALTEPGTGVVHINIHEPGEYVIYCTVPGHREAGMEGTLIVQSSREHEDLDPYPHRRPVQR